MRAFNSEKAKQSLHKREEEKQNKRMKLFRKAQKDFTRISEMLITKYKPLRLYCWGSLLNPETFTEVSDIDIAVEGFTNPMDGLHAQSDAENLTDFPVDLVELERIHPLHAVSIRTRGKLFYERERVGSPLRSRNK